MLTCLYPSNSAAAFATLLSKSSCAECSVPTAALSVGDEDAEGTRTVRTRGTGSRHASGVGLRSAVTYEPAEESVTDRRNADRPAVVSTDGGAPLMNIVASDPRIRKLFAISYRQ
jgi:hypothetical protein